MNYKKFITEIDGKEIIIETGKYCGQTAGSCLVRCGETAVMVNALMSDKAKEGQSFFPLTVDYEEKMYAVGKIPGGFKKREGRGSDKAILTSRLIDRPLRPLFEDGFYNDVVIVATALSVDNENAPEPLAMLGSSVALTISKIPFNGPTGSVLVGLVDGKFISNPTYSQRAQSQMELYVSGTDKAILMVEAGAKEVGEETMADAIFFAHEAIKKQVAFQNEIAKEIGLEKVKPELYSVPADVESAVKLYAYKRIEEIYDITDADAKNAAEKALEEDVMTHFAEIFPEQEKDIEASLENFAMEIMRKNILERGIRPDGRRLTEIRPIWCEVGILPRVHGSGVFTRGRTQALTTLTLGTMAEIQKLDGLDDEVAKRYMHHYNMPGYASGEARGIRAPGRREIGHGALAERALEAVLPTEEEFPYAIRTVSEILSSNGSTSQAAVCGSSLALMDAGVPIKAPVSGIAMGLIKDEETGKIAILSDIKDVEDFYGDMDFKVAGTAKGITALQMDIKVQGIDKEILAKALLQAKEGRAHILGEMTKVLATPRAELSKYAPKIISFAINPEKIGDVVGKQGKVINKIIDETGVKIDISDDGVVSIASNDAEMLERAKEIILLIVEDVKVNQKFFGKVARIMAFGAFVELGPTKEGMIHISKLSKERVEKVEDVVTIGDVVEVEVIKVDEKGRIDLRLLNKLK